MKFRIASCILVVAWAICLAGCKEDGDLIFHDQFEIYEMGTMPRGPWSKSGDGIIRIDSGKHYSGNYSLYFESGEGFDQRAFLKLTGNPLFPFAFNRINGSFYIWLEEAPADGIHWTMIQAGGPVRDRNYHSEIRYGGQHHQRLMANYDTKGIKSDCWQHSNTVMPEKEWVKISWQFDGQNQITKFWLNDELIDDLTTQGSGQGCVHDDLLGEWQFPVFTELLIGWVDYQSGGGVRRFWIDDVMLYY